MKRRQRDAFEAAISEAEGLIAAGDDLASFPWLERAHVLGQFDVRGHVRVHAAMLGIAWRARQPAAVLGQLTRIALGALGSAVGSVPTGNTGGSNISMFKRLPIDPEIEAIIRDES